MPLVVIVFEFSTLNGGERSMLSILDSARTSNPGFEFAAIGPPMGRLSSALTDRGIPYVEWSVSESTGIRKAADEIEASLIATIQSVQPDLVHANSLAMARLLGRLEKRLDTPTTGHLRDIIKLSATAITDLNRNQKLVAVSEATRLFHIAQGIEPARVIAVHNGIDLDQFRPRTPTGYLHAELRLNPAAKLIACIGQIGLRKGQDLLAAAAAFIVERLPDTHFLLIGERTSQKAESIAFEQNIGHRFSQSGLSDRLHMLGHRDDVVDILAEIDLLVHPANQEPFGRVLLEASAAGVPMVATDVGGTSEIIVDQLTGRLVPPRDSASLATAVIAILSDEVESQRLRTNTRNRAVREFSIDVATNRLLHVWSDVLKGSAKKRGGT